MPTLTEQQKRLTETIRLLSRLRLKFALMLARDIQLYHTSDPARFARMVDNHGKATCTLAGHIKNINGIISDSHVNEYYPVACRILAAWLRGRSAVQ